jgi:outer membrane murein-binding lipoprotein Lpp
MVWKRRWKHAIAIPIALLLLVGIGWSIGIGNLPATASVESDVVRLESEIFQLRSQVGRLESDVRRLSSPGRSNASDDSTATTQPGLSNLSGDPMFDRLATLVIELNRRVDRLEQCQKTPAECASR